MTIKASGRSALILATGLFVCFAGPSQAAAGADGAAASSKTEKAGAPIALNKYAKPGARNGKKYARRKSSKLALKSSSSKKAAPLDDVAIDDRAGSPAMPSAVANANAQLASADPLPDNAKAMSARANNILLAVPANQGGSAETSPAPVGMQVVAADQLNELDRALQESKAPPLVMAAAEPPVAPVAVSSTESSTWDQTSLIGKIFIAFGGLLTLASAARMFMA
jgi:hypothetical protein